MKSLRLDKKKVVSVVLFTSLSGPECVYVVLTDSGGQNLYTWFSQLTVENTLWDQLKYTDQRLGIDLGASTKARIRVRD